MINISTRSLLTLQFCGLSDYVKTIDEIDVFAGNYLLEC